VSGVVARLRQALAEPQLRGLDVDTPEFAAAHRRILARKAIVRRLFERFYRECRRMDLRHFARCPGRRLEIGSGAGFVHDVYPDVVTSDVKPLPFVDLVCRAERLPVRDASLRAIYAINVFHHLPDPRGFFRAAIRALHPGGGVVLVEPFHGPLARRLFRDLFTSERFDADVPAWEPAPDAGDTGPMSNANQALSYVVFVRDRTRFAREFPELTLVVDRPHTHLWYVASGGVNFRQLVPTAAIPLLRAAEWALAPLAPWIALQHTIVLRRR
jgi:SAM-dependent methyltransferase